MKDTKNSLILSSLIIGALTLITQVMVYEKKHSISSCPITTNKQSAYESKLRRLKGYQNHPKVTRKLLTKLPKECDKNKFIICQRFSVNTQKLIR